MPHTVIADNAGGHLMQRGEVDLVIVGCDRVSAHGDVCNKIGTYLKALAAHDNALPFYVAMPTSTLDLSLHDGLAQIPIEYRSAREVTHLSGRAADGTTNIIGALRRASAAARPTARWSRCSSCPTVRRQPIRPSTSRRRGWSAA